MNELLAGIANAYAGVDRRKGYARGDATIVSGGDSFR